MLYGWLLLVCGFGSHNSDCLPAQRVESARACERIAQSYRSMNGSITTRCVEVRKEK